MVRRTVLLAVFVSLAISAWGGPFVIQREMRALVGYEHVLTWDGTSGHGRHSLFQMPFGVACHGDGQILVSDVAGRFVVRATVEEGAPIVLHVVTDLGSGAGQLRWPVAVEASPSSDVRFYVADYLAKRIECFDDRSTPVGSISAADGAGEFLGPRDVAYTPGFFTEPRLYVTDFARHCVFRRAGETWSRWGGLGSAPGQFRRPCGIALSPDGGFVYVVDRDNHRVQQFDGEGDFVKQWGGEGDGPGKFRHPEGIAVAQDGTVFVTDTGNNRVQRFNVAGGFVVQWGHAGDRDDPYGLNRPRGIAVSPAGLVYVCDSRNGVLRIYRQRALPGSG